METACSPVIAWLSHTAYQLMRICLIAGIGWLVIRYIESRLTKTLSKLYPGQLVTTVIARFFTYVAWAILLIAILFECGINISGLLGAAGVVGVAVGFASQTSVANIISGLFLMIERPFELEDTLVVNDIEGQVADINLFAITLRTQDNRLARIPNEQLLKNVILNLTRLDMRRYQFTLYVDPQQDFNQVLAVLNELASKNQYCMPNHPVYMVCKSLTGSYLELLVGMWVPTKQLIHAKETVLIAVNRELRLKGIKLFEVSSCVQASSSLEK